MKRPANVGTLLECERERCPDADIRLQIDCSRLHLRDVRGCFAQSYRPHRRGWWCVRQSRAPSGGLENAMQSASAEHAAAASFAGVTKTNEPLVWESSFAKGPPAGHFCGGWEASGKRQLVCNCTGNDTPPSPSSTSSSSQTVLR